MKPRGYEKAQLSLALQLCDAVEDQSLQDILKLLDSSGANPNMFIPEKGISPFHLAIGCESYHMAEEMTRIFLQWNGNPNVRSEDGLTPLHVAAVWGRTGLVVLLLSCGGDPWLRDTEHGFTPLHLALKEEHFDTALVLQRHQLMDRRRRYSEGLASPRYNIKLEAIMVHAGEMQAEYAMSPQDNISPVLVSPLKGIKKVNDGLNIGWNIEPAQSQEYVRQWCHKEFMPAPATSTPTHLKSPKYNNILNQHISQSRNDCDFDECEKTPDITSSKEMTPKKVNCSTSSTTNVSTPLSKNLLKGSTDVRKKLFMELKKRFNGFKQSLDASKDDVIKTGYSERKGSIGYFSRKSILKTDRAKIEDPILEADSKTHFNIGSSCASANVNLGTSLNVNSRGNEAIVHATPGCEVKFCMGDSPIDEVDAMPLEDTTDTSVEWIASQSCFSDQHSPDSTNSQAYFTCDEGSVLDSHAALSSEKLVAFSSENIAVPTTSQMARQILEAPLRPPRRKELNAISSIQTETAPSNAPSSTSFGTIVSEEYRYTDNEAGVILIENHLLKKPVDVPSPSDSESVVSVPHTVSDAHTTTSDVSTVPASFSYDTLALRKELVALGEEVGPITTTTKKVYLRRLYRLKKRPNLPCSISRSPEYPCELQNILRSENWEMEIMTFSKLENLMSAPFENPDPNRRWREGLAKSSFNYLLLDPRISCNLPAHVTVHDLKSWRQFISSVFYIGKGKRSRPYAHLYQAVQLWNKDKECKSSNAKTQRILDVWRDGHGVVCLHIFQNIIPVEAFSREAAMLDAIGTNNLVNVKRGEYYGPASTWRIRQKRQLGIYLLYRAMQIFLCEGERQLRPGDID